MRTLQFLKIIKNNGQTGGNTKSRLIMDYGIKLLEWLTEFKKVEITKFKNYYRIRCGQTYAEGSNLISAVILLVCKMRG